MGLAPGTVLEERYRIDRLVGGGGFSEVYAAQHVVLNVPVAVRVLRYPDAATPDERTEMLRRFREEAVLLTKLRHVSVVRALDQAVLPAPPGAVPTPFLVLEWCGEKSLKELLGAEGPRAAARDGALDRGGHRRGRRARARDRRRSGTSSRATSCSRPLRRKARPAHHRLRHRQAVRAGRRRDERRDGDEVDLDALHAGLTRRPSRSQVCARGRGRTRSSAWRCPRAAGPSPPTSPRSALAGRPTPTPPTPARRWPPRGGGELSKTAFLEKVLEGIPAPVRRGPKSDSKR